jgi:hypothetical protein
MSDYVLRFLKIYDVGSFPNLSMFEKRFEKFWKNPYPSISSDIRKLGPGHVRRSETLRSRLAAIDSLAKTNLEIQICDRLRTTIIYIYVYICVYIYVYNVYIYTYVHHWFWIWKSLGIAWGQPIFRYQAIPNLDQTHVSDWNCTTSDWGGCSAPPEPQEEVLLSLSSKILMYHVGYSKIHHPQSH